MLFILVHEPMEESGTAARVADDEYRLPDLLLAVTREEHFIQEEKETVDKLSGDVEDQPDKKHQETPGSQTVMLPPGLKESFEVIAKKSGKIKVHVSSPPRQSITVKGQIQLS